MAKAIQKQGKEGPLFLYRITYTGQEHDPGMAPMTWNTWAYNLEHAEDKFYDTDDGEGWTILSIARVLDSTSQHRAIQHKPRHAMETMEARRTKKPRFPHRHEDDLVKDPTLLPSALADRYERELPQFQAVSSRTTMPRQWDFGNVTELSSGATTIVVTLNVAQGEVSGNATIDGMVIAQARASTADAAISRLMGDVAFELGDDKTPHEATEYRGVVPVRK
ncbi:MAG: hypothetical protein WB770_08630 [Acidimicrobiales bacterium]